MTAEDPWNKNLNFRTFYCLSNQMNTASKSRLETHIISSVCLMNLIEMLDKSQLDEPKGEYGTYSPFSEYVLFSLKA